MKKAGRPQFHYDAFIKAYEGDPSIKKIVRNFNKDEIMFKDKDNATEVPDAGDAGADKVSQMAKRATDLG